MNEFNLIYLANVSIEELTHTEYTFDNISRDLSEKDPKTDEVINYQFLNSDRNNVVYAVTGNFGEKMSPILVKCSVTRMFLEDRLQLTFEGLYSLEEEEYNRISTDYVKSTSIIKANMTKEDIELGAPRMVMSRSYDHVDMIELDKYLNVNTFIFNSFRNFETVEILLRFICMNIDRENSDIVITAEDGNSYLIHHIVDSRTLKFTKGAILTKNNEIYLSKFFSGMYGGEYAEKKYNMSIIASLYELVNMILNDTNIVSKELVGTSISSNVNRSLKKLSRIKEILSSPKIVANIFNISDELYLTALAEMAYLMLHRFGDEDIIEVNRDIVTERLAELFTYTDDVNYDIYEQVFPEVTGLSVGTFYRDRSDIKVLSNTNKYLVKDIYSKANNEENLGEFIKDNNSDVIMFAFNEKYHENKKLFAGQFLDESLCSVYVNSDWIKENRNIEIYGYFYNGDSLLSNLYKFTFDKDQYDTEDNTLAVAIEGMLVNKNISDSTSKSVVEYVNALVEKEEYNPERPDGVPIIGLFLENNRINKNCFEVVNTAKNLLTKDEILEGFGGIKIETPCSQMPPLTSPLMNYFLLLNKNYGINRDPYDAITKVLPDFLNVKFSTQSALLNMVHIIINRLESETDEEMAEYRTLVSDIVNKLSVIALNRIVRVSRDKELDEELTVYKYTCISELARLLLVIVGTINLNKTDTHDPFYISTMEISKLIAKNTLNFNETFKVDYLRVLIDLNKIVSFRLNPAVYACLDKNAIYSKTMPFEYLLVNNELISGENYTEISKTEKKLFVHQQFSDVRWITTYMYNYRLKNFMPLLRTVNTYLGMDKGLNDLVEQEKALLKDGEFEIYKSGKFDMPELLDKFNMLKKYILRIIGTHNEKYAQLISELPEPEETTDEPVQFSKEVFNKIKDTTIINETTNKEDVINKEEVTRKDFLASSIQNSADRVHLKVTKKMLNALSISNLEMIWTYIESYNDIPIHIREILAGEFETALSKFDNFNPQRSISDMAQEISYIKEVLKLSFKPKKENDIDLVNIKHTLDKGIYGLDPVKTEIEEYFAKRISVEDGHKVNPILLIGPPGVGKTTIVNTIAEVLGLPVVKINLGSIKDMHILLGHSRTYVASKVGRLVKSLQNSNCSNPIILFDEIDKAPEEIQNALLDILDPSQRYFEDHFLDFQIDISKSIIIGTANYHEKITSPILDRMDTIWIEGYTQKEKKAILQKFTVPKELAKLNLTKKDIKITAPILEEIVTKYVGRYSAGIRQSERIVRLLISKANVFRLKNESYSVKEILDSLVDYKYMEDDSIDVKSFEIGQANGLSVAGDVVGIVKKIYAINNYDIAAFNMNGRAMETMKESFEVATHYLKSFKGYKEFKKQERGVHLLFGDLDGQKDGPSAGAVMTIALISRVLELPVNQTVAMTGTILTNGKIGAVGGVDLKIAGAIEMKVKKVLIPKRVSPEEMKKIIDKKLGDKIEIIQVESIAETLEHFFKPLDLEKVREYFEIKSKKK